MSNYIGYTLELATGAPATDDKAGNEALTFEDVTSYSTVPVSRFSTSDIDVDDLFTGITLGTKGMGTGQNQTIAFHKLSGDTGHAAVIAAAAVDQAEQVTWRVGRPSGIDEVEYLTGILRNYQPKEGNGQNDAGFTVEFRQNRAGLITTRPV